VSVRVTVPSQLRGYTAGLGEVAAEGATLDAVLHDLDRRYPGFRFRVIDEQDRVRRHIVLFVNGERSEDLGAPMGEGARLFIVGALSGG
jgi:molybdopterin converting factor small subunit